MKQVILVLMIFLMMNSGGLAGQNVAANQPKHTFEIGENDFLYDGKPFVIRCGEMHFARIPREYWQHRLRMAHAMGLNTVCAYLFWNFHELEQGKFNWSGMADAAEFCRLAQQEGLNVILRPGPYSCAEWEFGGFPWWLLKKDDIKLRTLDPYYLEACRAYLKEVGRVLGSMQITKGGPILMVQVENEYGSYGKDREYIGQLRDYLAEAGFEVPFFTCDGPSQLKNDVREDIFCVVNFGDDPEGCFKALREIRPTGPLMNGEYYPGWFDSWGKPHHTGTIERVNGEITWMLDHRASFSIYMVHGGTTFGTWAGANHPPFSPQTSSYDYDAPISEAGWDTPKFYALRETLMKYLEPGEIIPEVPSRKPTITIPEFKLTEVAPVFDNLPKPLKSKEPLTFEELNQPFGSVLYRKHLPAGPAATLVITEVRDFALVYMDGKKIGILDRRQNQNTIVLPAHAKEITLDILVEAMGRINYGAAIHDRKGITEKVELITDQLVTELTDWEIYPLPMSETIGFPLNFRTDTCTFPAFHRGNLNLETSGDCFLDVSSWGKGLVWVNGHCLGRFWNIGPTQTMYLPAPWLKKGVNEVIVFDILGPKSTVLSGLELPILDKLNVTDAVNPHKKPGQVLNLKDEKPVLSGEFTNNADWKTVTFKPAEGRYFCLEALNSFDKQPFTTIAELYLIGENGKELSRENWKVVYADSEEMTNEDGKADNIFDLQSTTIWHTQWADASPEHPHQVVIDLGGVEKVAGFKYLPRQDSKNGWIKDYRIFLSKELFKNL